jgi:photosystem II stability/assembly factor-like uncharacterized protein
LGSIAVEDFKRLKWTKEVVDEFITVIRCVGFARLSVYLNSKMIRVKINGLLKKVIQSGAIVLLLCFLQRSIVMAQKNNPNGRNDAWGFVGIGGGGAMFYPAFSPHNPDVVFIACDMGGGYVTYNGGNTWRMFNLINQIKFYVFDPLDSNTVYANASGLFKSTDRGNTWRLLYPNPSSIIRIISKGDHADEVLVTKDSTVKQVLSLVIDPANSNKLYAGIALNKSTALYSSDDGGVNWVKEKELHDGVKNIFIDPTSPLDKRTIYVVSNNTLAQRKNGEWQINKGPEENAILTEISGGFDAVKKKYFIYTISRNSVDASNTRSTIYETTDGGKTWLNRQAGLLSFNLKNAKLPEWRTLATSAFHPEVLYVSYSNLTVKENITCSGVAKSTDYGKTWKLVWKDELTKEGMKATSNFSKDWLNDRYGFTWGENPLCMGVSPTNPAICFGTDFGRTIKTSNGGKTWQQVYSKNKNNLAWSSTGLEVTTGYGVVFDPFDKQHVFMMNTDIGLLESKDGTISWNSATKNNGIPVNWTNTCYWLTFDHEVKGRAWAVMSEVHDLPRPKMFRKKGVTGYNGGILITENGGKTWQPVSGSIGEAAMTHILMDPASKKESRTIYACAFGKGVYKSVDGGKTWAQKNKGLSGAEPFAWQIVQRENDGILFLVVSRRSEDGSIGNDKDGALYRSDDSAESWTRISLPEGTNGPTSLLVGRQHAKQLVLSAWGRVAVGQFAPDTGGGIFVSDDEGKTWKQVMEKDQHICDVTFDKRNNRFYACGFNGAAYYSADGASNWNRIKGYNFKWGKKVDFDPADPEKIFIITFGGGVWYGPAKGDEQAKEDIITPFK